MKGNSQMKYLTKKAAMFGLDARIALAIFGALSVISGAALYSVIQESKATAMLAIMQEIGKAWEQYMLDTGQDLPRLGDYNRIVSRLRSDNITGWKGPYLSYSESSENSFLLEIEDDLYISITSVSDLEWGLGATEYNWNLGAVHCNDTTIPCYTAIDLASSEEQKIKPIFDTLDKKIDNNDGTAKGGLRYYTWGTEDATRYAISYRYAPHKMP